MYTKVKTPTEIMNMKDSGRILGLILKKIETEISEGMSGKDLSMIAEKELARLGGEPAFLHFNGFPDIICVSINDQVVHGIPNNTPFKNGDIVSFDFGVRLNGMNTDAARTVIIGPGSSDQKKLVMNTDAALQAGIEQVKNNVSVGDIGAAVQTVLDQQGLGIVRDLVGHGVGHEVHEDPNIPNYGKSGSGPILVSGMTIAIEPMATLGAETVQLEADEWTITTTDGSLAAHFEDTILITDDGYEVLTRA